MHMEIPVLLYVKEKDSVLNLKDSTYPNTVYQHSFICGVSIILSIRSIVRKLPFTYLAAHTLHKLPGFAKPFLLVFTMMQTAALTMYVLLCLQCTAFKCVSDQI